MNYKKLLYIGVFIILVSILIGVIGTLWGIIYSFVALESAETVGIGEVGAGIEYAIFFTVISIIGSIVGLILAIFGGVKLHRNKKSQTES